MLKATIVSGHTQNLPLIVSFAGLPELSTACERGGIPLFGLTGYPDRDTIHSVTIDQLRKIGFAV
jgi:hypothetical protein